MCVPYWWCTKHAQLIMGTWPIYKKHFLQLILTKKTFHLIKYLLATFIFFPFFSICTCHNITYDTAIAVAESKSYIRITTDTPYLALTGELWGVYCEDFGENWQRYDGTAMHRRVWCRWKRLQRSLWQRFPHTFVSMHAPGCLNETIYNS